MAKKKTKILSMFFALILCMMQAFAITSFAAGTAKGGIEIVNNVAGASSTANSAQYVVELSDANNATYSGHTFVNGQCAVTINANDSVLIEGIPVGTEFSVSIAAGGGDPYTSTDKVVQMGTIINRVQRLEFDHAESGSQEALEQFRILATNKRELQYQNETVFFDKYLIMDETTPVPNVEVSFSVTHNATLAREADPTHNKVKVMEGIGTPVVNLVGDETVHKAVFAPGDDTSTGGYAAAGEKYAVRNMYVDFDEVEFTKPGVYRYVVSESCNNPNVECRINGTPAETPQYLLDVYVLCEVDSETGVSLSDTYIAGYNMFPVTGTLNASTIASYDVTESAGNYSYDTEISEQKSSDFTNYVTSTPADLTISKTVEGNQASREQFFTFTVAVAGAGGDSIAVDVSNAPTIDTPANPTTIALTNGSGSATFRLQHGQSIVVTGLLNGTTVTISEDALDYKQEVDQSGLNTAEDNDSVVNGVATVHMNGVNKSVSYNNKKIGTIPTGVDMPLWTGMVLILSSVFALYGMIGGKKKWQDM